MNVELRNPVEARRYLLQGLWWQRVLPPAAAGVRPALGLALEIVSRGQSLPPLGFVADVANALNSASGSARNISEFRDLPGVPANLPGLYEDHVPGKLYADWTFSRAADALHGYEGRDRERGIAFLVARIQERATIPGVEISPGIIKTLLEVPGEKALLEGWQSLTQHGPMPILREIYEMLPGTMRRIGEVLGNEDLFELEHRTALAEPGERLALRQVLQAIRLLDADVPSSPPPSGVIRAEVATNLLEDDTYPVGGFSSLSTRGSVESLLHSQLAYMEPAGQGPDLFDIKFLRDELLYYSRDENRFLRHHRSFVIALSADLVATRFKDRELPFQRGILLLALIVVAIRRLIEWLSTDALHFDIIFVGKGEREELAAERALLETLMRDAVAKGTVRFSRLAPEAQKNRCEQLARRSQCKCLFVGVAPTPLRSDDFPISVLWINSARPALEGAEDTEADDGSAIEIWGHILRQLLERWS